MNRPDDNLLLPNPVQPCEVRVVTFDLDNTMWKTGPTIATANDVLAAFLEQKRVVVPVRVEKIMNEVFRANPSLYAPLESKAPSSPVLLTNLRKDAIRSVLETYNEYTPEAATVLADEAFQVWTEARHESILQHLADSTATCLQQIRELTTSQGTNVVIGAITDGNSDPKSIDLLSDYFDFCVNAERVGVSKPDKRMYLEAMRQVASQPILDDLFGSWQKSSSDAEDEEALENIMGPWWVHVGDDFVKDIVAAKSLKLRTIWARELTPSPQESVAAKSKAEAAASKSVEDFVKQVSEMKVIEMSVGADNYLADSITSEFADAIVDKFLDVANVLRQWQLESQPRQTVQRVVEPAAPANGLEDSKSLPEAPTQSAQAVPSSPEAKLDLDDSVKVVTKFCVYCGNKLPLAAKFCFACGEKQPELR